MKRPTDRQIAEAVAVLAAAFDFVMLDNGTPTETCYVAPSARGGVGLMLMGATPDVAERLEHELPWLRRHPGSPPRHLRLVR